MSIVAVDTSSELAVTDYLTKARDWLATCVQMTGPDQIAAAKAEIATAAEATKQLGLSKEIREDAVEMVRRAEYALRKSLNNAQAEGFVSSRESSLIPGARTRGHAETPTSDLPSPRSMFVTQSEYEAANEMGHLTPDEFDEVLTDAKAEGNLSRANVAKKAREKSGRAVQPATDKTERAHQEAELVNSFGSLVRRALTPKNVATLTPNARERLIHILETAIDTLKETSA